MNTDKKSLLHRILYFVLPVLLVTFWEVYSRKGLISQAIFPMPSKLVEAFKKLLDNGRLWSNLSISLQRVLKGFAFGSIIGILVGILMGLFRGINSLLSSLVSIFRPIPIVAWIPLFIVLMGIGEKPKVTMIAVGAFWPLLLNTIHGIQTVDRKLIDMARIHQKSKVEILFKIILPSALPSIFTGMKLGIATSWSAVVAAEMLAANKGIGYMIQYARELAQQSTMLVGVFVIGFIGILIDLILSFLQKRIVYWNKR